MEQVKNDKDYNSLKQFLDGILKEVGNMSNRSKHTFSLYEQMIKLNQVIAILDKIKDEDSMVVQQFHRVFRGLLKSYQPDGIMSEIGQHSGFENLSDDYIVEIREKLLCMTEGLKGLCNSIINNTSVHLLWYFISPEQEDLDGMDAIVKYLSETYQKKGQVKTYLDQEKFFKEMKEIGSKQNPIIAFISCSNYIQQSDEIFYCMFQLMELQKEIKIQGIIIQVDDKKSYEILKEEVQETALNKLEITYDDFEIYNEVYKFMNPKEFRRIILSEDINLYYFQKKDDFCKLHIDNFSKFNMLDFEPSKINLKEKLEQAIDFMKRKDIKVDPVIIAPELPEKLTKAISNAFQEAKNNEQEICKKILRLYTLEQANLYKFLNGCLNTLNEDVVIIIWDLVMMLRIALYKYDDTPFTTIRIKDSVAPKLYRGINLSYDYFKKIIKVDKIICLASFSSFSLSEDVAISFILQDDNFHKDRASIVFEYEHKISTLNYPQRPKSISHLSAFNKENEYLFPPSFQFKIYRIDDPHENFKFYKVYLTQGNQTVFQKN